MKIGAVQYKPVPGDVIRNIERHKAFIDAAVTKGVDLVYFPELSISGYEPKLAKALAMEESDKAFDDFQELSKLHKIAIGIGIPLAKRDLVQIGMLWFMPNRPRKTYTKQLLHSDEIPFFVQGQQQLMLTWEDYRLAPAICYESLQPDHAARAAELGAHIYLASVAKSAAGIEKGIKHYPKVAARHHMYVIMANSLGPCDDFVSTGNTSAWNADGKLLATIDGDIEGILVVDVECGEAVVEIIEN